MTYVLSGSYGSFPGPGDLCGSPNDDPDLLCDGSGIVVEGPGDATCPECRAVVDSEQDEDGDWIIADHDRGYDDREPDPPDYDHDGPWA